jgi:hypothetical protein
MKSLLVEKLKTLLLEFMAGWHLVGAVQRLLGRALNDAFGSALPAIQFVPTTSTRLVRIV